MSKRKRGDALSDNDENHEIANQLHQIITDGPTTQAAVLRVMEQFRLEAVVKTDSAEQGLDVSFSNVKYKDIASFVGLDYTQRFTDATLFDLRRSRIPTRLFRDIVSDMDILLTQYGNLRQHLNEETRSRFFAPIVNRLIAQFDSWIRNTPELLMAGRITKRGRVEYHYKSFDNFLSVVVVEVKWVIRDNERLDAIAQVIAECDACSWNNSKDGFNVPIYGILCDGYHFQFFAFDGSTNLRKFTMGSFPGNMYEGLNIVDFSSEPTARHFIRSLRPICETIFNLLLLAYIASSKASRDKCTSQQKSLDGWDKVLKFAEEALEKSQNAEALRQENSIVDADATIEAAFKALKLSTDAVPITRRHFNPPLMVGWDDDEVGKV